MQNELAAIDFNEHRVREFDRKEDGSQKYRALYSKRTRQWRPAPVLKPKEYKYISKPHTEDLSETSFCSWPC